MVDVELDYWALEKLFQVQKEWNITFTKKDGTIREMKCTRHPDLIPDDQEPKKDSDYKVNKEIFPVFDLENNGWRSFRVDSLTKLG